MFCIKIIRNILQMIGLNFKNILLNEPYDMVDSTTIKYQ